MDLQTTVEDGIVLIRPEHQLIVGNRQQLKEEVIAHIEKGETRFLFDFSQTGYIDSAGLGVLVNLSRKVRDAGGEMRLAAMNEDLKTLFELTRLDSLFQIYDSVEEARRSL